MSRRFACAWLAAAGLVAALAACSSPSPAGTSAVGSTTPSAIATSPTSAPKPTKTAPTKAKPAPTNSKPNGPATGAAGTFTNGATYFIWIDGFDSAAPNLHVRLGDHLVDTPTDKAATKYLTSHGQTVPPDGIPDDYINVDLGKSLLVPLSKTAAVTINPEGTQQTVTVSKFFTWLKSNLATEIPPADRDKYPGAATLGGPIFAVTFHAGSIVTLDQVFEP